MRLSVCSSRTERARVLKFHIWIPHGKNSCSVFFVLSELSPFLELCPFEKKKKKKKKKQNEILIDDARFSLSFFFFFVRVISLAGVMPVWKNQNGI